MIVCVCVCGNENTRGDTGEAGGGRCRVNDKLQRAWTVKERGRSEQMHFSSGGHLFKFIFKKFQLALSWPAASPYFFFFFLFRRGTLSTSRRVDKNIKKRQEGTESRWKRERILHLVLGHLCPLPHVCTCRHTLTGWILISTLSSTCRLKDSADSKRAFPCILNDALLKNQTEKKNRKRIQIYSTLDIECVRVCVCIKLRFILHMEVFSFYLQGHTGKPFFIYLFFYFPVWGSLADSLPSV